MSLDRVSGQHGEAVTGQALMLRSSAGEEVDESGGDLLRGFDLRVVADRGWARQFRDGGVRQALSDAGEDVGAADRVRRAPDEERGTGKAFEGGCPARGVLPTLVDVAQQTRGEPVAAAAAQGRPHVVQVGAGYAAAEYPPQRGGEKALVGGV